MNDAVLWGITAVAVVIGIGLIIHLVRKVHGGREEWKANDTFAALALIVTILVAVLPQLFARDDTPDPAVVAYRQDVAAACAALTPSSNPFMEAMGAGVTIDRARLEQGLRNQLTGAYGVLQELWSKAAPESLADEVAEARTEADNYLAASSSAIDALATEVPETLSMAEFAGWAGTYEARLRPAASRFEAAMSKLGDGPCQAPSVATEQD